MGGYMRETIVWILFCVMLALASFGGGYIYRDEKADELRKEVYQQEKQVRDLIGRMTSVETIMKKK